MKRFAIACIIALTLCAGCESSGNTGEKSAVTSHTEKVSETTVEAVTTEEVTTTATETEPDDELTVTTETDETTTVEDVSTTVTADNAETVTTATTSVADNTRTVGTTVTKKNSPINEDIIVDDDFIIFDAREDEEDSNGENVDIPENITGNEESQDDTDSGVIELPFVPFG